MRWQQVEAGRGFLGPEILKLICGGRVNTKVPRHNFNSVSLNRVVTERDRKINALG